jgi:nucleoside-diphosphate-sugar epimerase
MKILICGQNSFVAYSLFDKLIKMGFDVDCFSRGEEGRNGFQVTGNVLNLNSNSFFKTEYDIVLNFILIKDKSVKDNIDYISSLVDFCKTHRVKNLIQISSISVYSNSEKLVNESTNIEYNSNKEGYSRIKIEVDKFLESVQDTHFKISFIRLGYVIAADRPIPFIKKFFFDFVFIKGSKRSILPLVNREVVHEAFLRIISSKEISSVYLFVPSDNRTKNQIVKDLGYSKTIFMPEYFILKCSYILKSVGIISNSFYYRIEGMFISTHYDSRRTQELLNIKF